MTIKNRTPKDSVSLLYEEMDEEILERMPEWYKLLRRAYEKSKN